jgi:acetyl esterase/lipase
MVSATAGRVSIEEGIIFGSGGGRDLKCDVYSPPAETANGAGVLIIHGGGWARGDRKQLRGYGILLGRKGYACVACEYRLSGEAKWPAQLHDVKAGLRWMRANATRLGIDAAKIAVEGNSAGGHLTLMLAGTQNVAAFEGDGGNAGAGTEVAAAIAFYAPALLSRAHREREVRIEGFDAVGQLLGDDISDASLRDASPITHVGPSYPPTLLFTGNKDLTVPAAASFRMYEALNAAGAPVELHTYNGAPHAFDAVPELGRQCADIMALFLDRHVVRPRPVEPPPSTT